MRKIGRLAVVLLVSALALSACESLNPFAKKKEAALPGERIPVLQGGSAMTPDPKLKDLTIALPKPRVNPAWPQAGGYPSHAMYHLALAPKPSQAWRVSIGSGSSKSRRLTVQPVIGGGRIYSMDAWAVVRAFDAKSGNSLWENKVLPKEEKDANLSGGVAFDKGRLYVATGAAEVLALDAGTGKEIWRVKAGAPMRSAPTVGGGRVYVVTVQNELIAFAVKDGKELWRHAGLPETAGFLGSASPAYANGILIVPHTSGEIYALRANNGRQLWTDTIASVRRVTAVAALTHIRGHPVIDRGRVYVVSHSGRLAAIDLRTGNRVWDLDVGALQMPWVAGEFVFVLTNDGKLAALRRDNGRVKWVTELLRYVDKSKRKKTIFWVGPVLAGDRLVVSGSHGEVLSVSPYSGKVLGWLRMSEGVLVPPLVASGTLYILDDDGDLSAYR